MKQLLCSVVVAVLAGGAATSVLAQAPNLQLTMTDGRVTIIARDVPLRDLLVEWSRVGQTRIVNADKLAGSRVTLQLVDTAERDALDILLRSAAGYIAAPRPGDRPGTSAYDRITILASSRPPALTAPAAPPPPIPNPAAETDDTDDAAFIEPQDDAQQSLMENPQGQSVAPVSSPRPARLPGQRPPSRYARQPPGGGGGG